MKISIKEQGIPVWKIVLLFLFCAMMNVVNRYYYFVFVAFFVFLLCYKRIVKDTAMASLLLFSISMMCFSPTAKASLWGLIKPYTYPMCYIIGYGMFVETNKNPLVPENERYIRKIVIILASGGFMHYMLNWLTNMSSSVRNTVDFWTGVESAATNQAAMSCMMLAVAIAAILSHTRLAAKLMSLVIVVLILNYNLLLSGRTLIVMTLLILLIGIIYRLHKKKKGRIAFLLSVCIVSFLLIFAYNTNMFGLRDLVEDSSLYKRFTGNYAYGLTEDSRMENKLFYLNHLLDYPFGGLQLRSEIGYAHDIFLDSYDEAGWLALGAIIVYFVTSVARMLRLIRDERYSFELRQMILCTYAIVYIEFLVEPVIQASPWLVAAFCVIDGSLCGVLRLNKNTVKERQIQQGD